MPLRWESAGLIVCRVTAQRDGPRCSAPRRGAAPPLRLALRERSARTRLAPSASTPAPYVSFPTDPANEKRLTDAPSPVAKVARNSASGFMGNYTYGAGAERRAERRRGPSPRPTGRRPAPPPALRRRRSAAPPGRSAGPQWRRLNPRRSCPRHAQPTNLGGLRDSELIPTLLGRQVESSTQSASAAAANAALQALIDKQVRDIAAPRPSCESSLSYAPTYSQLCSSRLARRVAGELAVAEALTNHLMQLSKTLERKPKPAAGCRLRGSATLLRPDAPLAVPVPPSPSRAPAPRLAPA